MKFNKKNTPLHPEIVYEDEWKGWDDFLGITKEDKEKRAKEEIDKYKQHFTEEDINVLQDIFTGMSAEELEAFKASANDDELQLLNEMKEAVNEKYNEEHQKRIKDRMGEK